MIICKVTQDLNTNSDKLDNQDYIDSKIERVAEKLMVDVETSIAWMVNADSSIEITRADIQALCSTEKFNDLFYSIAKKIVK